MSIYTHCIAQQDGVKPASDVFPSAFLAYSLMFWRVTSAQIRSPAAVQSARVPTLG
jgi:hypothetical protein